MQLSPGNRLGPYEIVSPLGAGGMGEVYRARDPRLGRDVAIKIIAGRNADDAKTLERFEQEARAIAAVSNPNILAIHDVGRSEGHTYAVMELLDGEPLDDRLARERLSWHQAIDIAAAVADGLAAAHGRGIVHRDLKPANIFLTRDGLVKILDFGLAKSEGRPDSALNRDRTTSTDTGVAAGTTGYMSPEQVTGAGVDARTDIFALGCVLYEMLSGRRAFRGASAGETLAAILRDDPGDLACPAALASIVRRCLRKNPDERFQSARDLAFALKQAGAKAANAAGRGLRYAAAAAIVIAGAVGAYSVLRTRNAREIHSVAVLPLANASGDSSQEYLADGVTEQMISDIARINGVRVTSQTSSMSYKGSKRPLPEIARALGVDAVVEGSVVRSGDRIKITAELIDARSDRSLWSETYERDVRDVLALQREIAGAVASRIAAELTPARAHAVDPRSFDALIRARYAFNKGTRDELFRAVDLFRQALDADPTNADAYAGLADTYALIGYWNFVSPGDAFPKAKAAAMRALEIDRNSAQAHGALGYIHMYYDWDFVSAESEFREAIRLNPSLASAHRYYAIYLAAMLRPDEARREAAEARALDPLSVPVATDAGFVLYYERDYEKAAKTLKDAVAMNANAAGPHFWLGRVYQAEARYAEAANEYRAAGPGVAKLPALLAGLGHMDAVTGNRAEAERVLAQIESTPGYVSPYAPALVHLGLGDREKTLELLDRCLDERTNWLVWLLKDPRWDPMRSDPRFHEIVRKVGFPADALARTPHAS